MRSRMLVVSLALLWGVVASPGRVGAAERILIPVFLGERTPSGFGFAAGVNGWVTTAVIANESTEPVHGNGVLFSLDCDIPEGCPGSSVPPGMVGQIFAPVSPAGLLLDVASSEQISLAAAATRWPAIPMPIGAQLPIARERDFVSRPRRFLTVPSGYGAQNRTRVHLRVYSLEAVPVRVRIEVQDFSTITGPIRGTIDVDLHEVQAPGPPRFAWIDLVERFRSSNTYASGWNVTVAPLPAADGRVPAIWAFISVTSPTNEVRIIPPG
jgi:hypothetical protein